jgi:UDP-N-acetylglucosamine--N-acetylmuramyl-(pentapeptide) pyrophosphoryl-undecaprenol N-acetylglucosamine transferase
MIVFTCGGTGGHLYPAIAVAQTLRDQGQTCVFLMANDREDLSHVTRYGFESVPISPSRGHIGQYLWGIYRAWRVLGQLKASRVFCTGGKITLAVAIAAWLRRLPVAVMEQNAIPGRANRLIATWADKVFITFPESQRYFANSVLSGNPIRQYFPPDPRIAALLQQRPAGQPTVLVLGGSQGAARLNTCVLNPQDDALNAFPSSWIILTGQRFAKDHHLPDHQVYTLGKRTVICIPYCEAMDMLYNAADVVVSRAGATTISEILAFQKPAILVPYPHAKDNHQEANARAICQKDGYRWCLESSLTGEFLAETATSLVGKQPAAETVASRQIIADWAMN